MTEDRQRLAGKWRRFLQRPREDREFILRAALLLPLTEMGLRLFGFRRWKELIEEFFLPDSLAEGLAAESEGEMALRVTRAVRSVELHGPSRPNCLERSMTLWWLLRRAGVPGELHIGARKQGERFEAHAWVELHGQVLNDSPEVHHHYSRFDAPIAPAMTESHAAGKSNSR
jgi:Transglutaminase-like superfamily